VSTAAHEAFHRRLGSERLMTRIRWGGVVLGVWQVVAYRPLPGETIPSSVPVATYGLLAILAAVNAWVYASVRRTPSEQSLRRVGALAFATDLSVLVGITWAWSFEEFGTTWVLLYLGSLEGALRYGLFGALLPLWVAIVTEPLRELYRSLAFDHAFQLSGVTFRVGMMALIAVFAGNLARSLGRAREEAERRAETLAELHHELEEKVEDLNVTREESRRRASLLATVAASARSMSALETEQVFASVVTAVQRLGFESADICLIDHASCTYRVVHAIGLPESYTRDVHPADEGLISEVRRARATVTIPNYAGLASGIPELRSDGYRAVVSTPVWAQGRLAAALTAGTHDARRVTPEEVEAIELLAAQAGRALENAQQFEEQRRTVARLEELDRLKQDFLDTVSHELRTPLTAVHGMGITLETRWDELDDETRRSLLERLNANAAALEEIITALLDFSRLDGSREALEVQDVKVGELVDGLLVRLSHLFEGPAPSALIEPDLMLRADPVLLERVMENLIANAGKHTPAGTPITISAAVVDGEVEIAVSDEGPGIADADMAHLTERFYRGGDPNSRPTRGTGLGLALVTEILELHRSALSIESTEDSGARFAFRLPLASRPERTRH